MSSASARSLTLTQGRGSLPILGAYVRAYPARSAAALIAVFVAGLLDGLGLSMLLSMLSLATGGGKGEPSMPERVALDVADRLGVAATAPNLLLLAIAFISLKAVLSLLANRQVGYTVAHIATDLRLTLIRTVMSARWLHYLQQSVGRLSNAVATEAQRASEIFQYGAETAVMILNSIIYVSIALSLSVEAGIAAAVAGGLLLALLHVLIRISRRAGQQQTDLLKSLLAVMSGQLSAAKPLKAMAREDHVDALLSDQTRQLKRALRRQVVSKEALMALQEPLLAILVGTGFFLSLVYLKMPMAAVVVMLFLQARVVSYLSKAQRAFQQVAVRESAYWSIVQSIQAARAQSERSGGDSTVQLARDIRFEEVSFSHEGRRAVIDRQSFTVPVNQLTVIVGPSGSGKTTVLDLLVGLLEPDAGRILIDGLPLTGINLRHWRRQIGYVPQESVMVDESVAHNLTLGEPIPDHVIREALQAADALEFVESMPDGLQSHVGEGGSRLSGGQRQRLAIARALIHQPRLLILDEATSNLDFEGQSAVVETVSHLKGRLTIIAVAHQDRLIEAADNVYRMADGQLRRIPNAPEGNVTAHA
jgi:ATP-binding cassette subfamily C protein